MKRTLVWCVLGTAIVAMAAWLSPAGSATGDEQTIRQLNEQCLKAFDVKNDVALDKCEADDFDILSEAGVQTRQEHLREVRADKSNVSPIDRTVENQKIRIYGNTAVVTQLDKASASSGSSSYQATYVWVRHSTEWKLVHLHYTKVG